MLGEMAAELEGVVQELQAGAGLGDKVQDDGQEGGELEGLDVLCGGTLGFVDGGCDGVCQAGDGEFGGVQVVGVVFEDLDDGGSVQRDLLAYVGAPVVGDGGQRPEREVAGIVVFDEGEYFCQETCRQRSSGIR